MKVPSTIWAVITEEGEVSEASAVSARACHEHINDALNVNEIEGAEKWVVREYTLKVRQPASTNRPGILDLFDAYSDATRDGYWDERAASSAHAIIAALEHELKEHGM